MSLDKFQSKEDAFEQKQHESNKENTKDNVVQNDIDTEPVNDSDMSFLGHLEELRKRVIFSLIGVVISCVGIAFFIESLLEGIFLKPAIDSGIHLQNLMPFGQPFLYFKVIIIVGIIISIPFTLYQI